MVSSLILIHSKTCSTSSRERRTFRVRSSPDQNLKQTQQHKHRQTLPSNIKQQYNLSSYTQFSRFFTVQLWKTVHVIFSQEQVSYQTLSQLFYIKPVSVPCLPAFVVGLWEWMQECMRVCTYAPGHRVSVEQVSKEPGHVPQFVCLQSMYGLILLCKYGLKALHVVLLQQTEPLHTNTGLDQVKPWLSSWFQSWFRAYPC